MSIPFHPKLEFMIITIMVMDLAYGYCYGPETLVHTFYNDIQGFGFIMGCDSLISFPKHQRMKILEKTSNDDYINQFFPPCLSFDEKIAPVFMKSTLIWFANPSKMTKYLEDIKESDIALAFAKFLLLVLSGNIFFQNQVPNCKVSYEAFAECAFVDGEEALSRLRILKDYLGEYDKLEEELITAMKTVRKLIMPDRELSRIDIKPIPKEILDTWHTRETIQVSLKEIEKLNQSMKSHRCSGESVVSVTVKYGKVKVLPSWDYHISAWGIPAGHIKKNIRVLEMPMIHLRRQI